MKKKITKKMSIEELVKKYPETVEVLSHSGFHCLGCILASFETLEQGAAAHGMNEKEINQLVEKLNQAIKKKS